MSRKLSGSEHALKPQPETSQPLPTPLNSSTLTAPDGSKFQGPNASTGYRSLKPAINTSMGHAQESGQTRPSENTTQTPSRALGVQSILNPSQPESQGEEPSSRPSSSRLPSYQSRTPQTAFFPPAAESPRIRKRNQRGTSIDHALPAAHSTGQRRTLTPISPGRRAESLGGRRQLPSLSAATQPPPAAHESRRYTAEPGRYPDSDIPPLPTTTALHRESPLNPYRGEAVQQQTRKASTGYGSAPAGPTFLTSQSESPSTPHSTYSHVGQTSPMFNYGNAPPTQQAYQPTQTTVMSGFQYPMANSGYGENQYPAGHGSYQMTLDTEQGPMIVPVEVDVQQASKIADEKRKRNAGASARFRARRKEKEKEAMHSISSMEKEVRAITEERDFYINERNFFRDFALRHLGRNQIPPRPPSPPVRRPLLAPLASESPATQAQDTYREHSTTSPRPAVRRRTGDYQPSLSRGTSPSPMFPPRMSFPSQYQTQVPPLPPPPPMPSLQGPYSEQRSLPPGPPPSRPPPPLPVPARSQPYDPFRPDLFDRSWDPGR